MTIEKDLEAEFEKQANDILKPNLMIIGGTGVGKSSLVNRVFGQELAAVSSGTPVTRGCNKYESQNIPLVIFDTEGYEIIDNKLDNSNFEKIVLAEIERRRQLELKEHIHLFWYCISAINHRITDYDIQNIKLLNNKHKEQLAIVITKCDEEEVNHDNQGVNSLQFRKVLQQAGIDNNIFETTTKLEEKLQLDDLIQWSCTSLPHETLKDAWVGAQRCNLPLKNEQAQTAILTASAAAAAAAGLNPFPMSDALTLVPIQMGLAARLATIYGFDAVSAGVTTLLKTQVVSIAGRQLAASLTKLIPVLGQMINATVAGAITAGLGFALRKAYATAYEELLSSGKTPDWAKIFSNLDIDSFIKKQFSKQ